MPCLYFEKKLYKSFMEENNIYIGGIPFILNKNE